MKRIGWSDCFWPLVCSGTSSLQTQTTINDLKHRAVPSSVYQSAAAVVDRRAVDHVRRPISTRPPFVSSGNSGAVRKRAADSSSGRRDAPITPPSRQRVHAHSPGVYCLLCSFRPRLMRLCRASLGSFACSWPVRGTHRCRVASHLLGGAAPPTPSQLGENDHHATFNISKKGEEREG